jgi:DNA-binding SARP family transcriptional activator
VSRSTFAPVSFLLLGPVTAVHDGEPVDLGRRQERLLLGLLLLDAGRPIPTPRLADLLWQGEPPEHARKVVQIYVARLRAHLRPAGPVIVSTGGGYRIDTADIDGQEFLGLVDRARSATPEDRGALLDQALGLWRGPLLGDDCPPPVRERIGARLEQARLDALARRAADHLARGDHAAAVDLLAGTAGTGGVHEPLVVLLMRAYTAGGRRAEALAAYEEARRRLRAQLGVHPGQSLGDERTRARRPDPPGPGRRRHPCDGGAWR